MSTLALCIPAYNAEWCLPRLLKSALNQSIPFDEILIYDDCSTDNTSTIGREFGATVIEGVEKQWSSGGKNKLAEVAKSEWLFFIDADDELLPNFSIIARQWMRKEDPADIILMPYCQAYNSTGQILGEIAYCRKGLISDPLKFTITNKIVNFELIKKAPFLEIGGFDTDPKILFIEDRAFAFRAAVNGLAFDTENEITCIKYLIPTSMSAANLSKCWEAGFHLWKKVYNRVGNKYSVDIAHQLFENAVWAAKADAWDVVKKSLRLAKEINPEQKPNGSSIFKTTFELFPFLSFYLREKFLRIL